MSLPKINLVVVGHKDHGKSTLIGRLLYDSKAISEQKLHEIKKEVEESGREFAFAFLLDSLEEERKGGLSIDILHTPFKSPKFFYTIIDCPGHREFIQKMLTGASQADAALLIVSATEGIQDQTKQHAFLLKTLGVNQLIVAINKMDQINYDKNRFNKICAEIEKILGPLGYEQTPTIPISAINGDNVCTKSKNMRWYNGLTLINTLDDTIHPSTLPVNKPLRGFVQDTYHRDGEEIIICKIETGILETGKTICFTPSGKQGVLKAITVFNTEARMAEPGDSVGLLVEDANTIERGEVISYPENKPKKVAGFVAEIILFSGIEIRTGDTLTLRIGTAEKQCKVQKILKELDPINLTVHKEHPEMLKEESVGELRLLALQPLCVEKYSELPQLGRFVVEGKKGTSAAGIILETS